VGIKQIVLHQQRARWRTHRACSASTRFERDQVASLQRNPSPARPPTRARTRASGQTLANHQALTFAFRCESWGSCISRPDLDRAQTSVALTLAVKTNAPGQPFKLIVLKCFHALHVQQYM